MKLINLSLVLQRFMPLHLFAEFMIKLYSSIFEQLQQINVMECLFAVGSVSIQLILGTAPPENWHANPGN